MTALLIDDVLARLGMGDRDALRWRGGSLTERAFASGMRAWMARFEALGIARGDRVALYLSKGPVAVMGLFAALARGAIAVPIDPATPPERLKSILGETGPACLIADRTIPEAACEVLEVDPFADGPPASLPDPGPVSLAAEDIALILTTSGTTGTPKGIAITHGNITAFSDWAIDAFTLTGDDRFISIAPLHFDLATFDILTSRRLTAPVYLAGKPETLFPGQLAQAIDVQRITVLYTVPTLLSLMHSHGGLASRDLSALRWILFAGEVFAPRALAALMADISTARYANLYGPTETNVVTWAVLETAPPGAEAPRIGKPCAHSDVVICDPHGDRLDVGRTGEICVSGPTVMAGYWQRPDLTRERYFGGDDTVFRTGDMGYAESDGSVRFVGRRDRQVKRRGHRIELGEIESVALSSGMVDHAGATAIMAAPVGGSLWLHVAVDALTDVDEDGLRTHLAARLPVDAMPDRIVVEEAWPVTGTGKTDLMALQARHRAALEPEEDAV